MSRTSRDTFRGHPLSNPLIRTGWKTCSETAFAWAARSASKRRPGGFDFDRTRKEAPVVTGMPWWAKLPASRAGRVWIVDGSSYFNRPGPRLVDGLEILAHILQPILFPKAPPATDAARVS